MINLTTNIPIANDIPNIRKWSVVDVHDYSNQTPPYLMITVTLFGPGAVAFGSYTLCIYDAPGQHGSAGEPEPAANQ